MVGLGGGGGKGAREGGTSQTLLTSQFTPLLKHLKKPLTTLGLLIFKDKNVVPRAAKGDGISKFWACTSSFQSGLLPFLPTSLESLKGICCFQH